MENIKQLNQAKKIIKQLLVLMQREQTLLEQRAIQNYMIFFMRKIPLIKKPLSLSLCCRVLPIKQIAAKKKQLC